MKPVYNVTIINPINGREETHRNVHEEQINFDNGTFRFNSCYPCVQVLTFERVSDMMRQAENDYFAKYGD